MIFREVEDRDLIAKARRGDVDAYGILVSRWEKRIFNYLLRLVGNREEAMDLSQDVFLKAWQNPKKLTEAITYGRVSVAFDARGQLSEIAIDYDK